MHPVEPREQLAAAATPYGEVALFRRAGIVELVVNGVFAMDTTDVTSELALADAAGPDPGAVVVGGLGLGFTAARLLTNGAAAVHVVELARPLIDWALAGVTEQLERVAHDARVQLHHADIAEWLPRRAELFDAVLLDVDNGPGFLIHDHNARVYATDWLTQAYERLAPGGVLVIWSQSTVPELATTLAGVGRVTETVIAVDRDGRHFEYALYRLHRDQVDYRGGMTRICGAVLTVSDRASAGEYTDTSGPLAVELLAAHGVDAEVAVVPDDPAAIRRGIRAAIKGGARVVVTTGGTGIAPRDVTPEVTAELFIRRLPGITDEIRRVGAEHVPTAVLSRAEAGIVALKKGQQAFVVNAPGSNGGVKDTVSVVGPLIVHVLEQLDGADHYRSDVSTASH